MTSTETIAELDSGRFELDDEDEVTVFDRSRTVKQNTYGELELTLPTEEETEAFLRSTEVPGGGPPPNLNAVNRWILLWHFLNRWMEESWGFLIPLLLIKTFPDSLVPIAVYAFFNKLIGLLFASNLGAWLDQQSRSRVLYLSILAQAISLGAAGFFLFSMVYQIEYNTSYNFMGSLSSGVLFLCLTISSLIGSIGLLAIRKSLENDWLPAVTPVIELISLKNGMSRVSFLTEILGPLFTAILLSKVDLVGSFLTIGCLYIVSLIPQWFALKRVLTLRPQLQRPGTKSEIQNAMLNPFSVIFFGFSIFRKQRVVMVILGNTLMHLSILNLKNPVFIAYLGWAELDPIYIALFVALAVICNSSLVNILFYSKLLGRLGLFTTTNLFLLFQTIMLLIGCITFTVSTSIFPLIIFVALSGCGVYAFKVSKIQIMEKGVNHENNRKIVENVDTAFNHVAQLTAYIFCLSFNDPMEFNGIVWSSFSFVILGVLIFYLWSCFRSNRTAIILG